MFSNKNFFEVNREERNYGFLLFSSLIYESRFRQEFIKIIKQHSSCLSEKIDDSDSVDIYAEASLFRDYWFNLGNQKVYTQETHQSRLITISEILDLFSVNSRIIGNYDLFWTGEIMRSKLWYPGKWETAKIQKIQQQERLKNNELLRIRWAFNAKPDILITANSWAAFIELKVESSIGENQHGYNQDKTLSDIISIAKKTIPLFHNKTIDKLMISQNEPESIKWSEVTKHIEHGLIQKYMNHIPK